MRGAYDRNEKVPQVVPGPGLPNEGEGSGAVNGTGRLTPLSVRLDIRRQTPEH
jgi:hypothetical protein